MNIKGHGLVVGWVSGLLLAAVAAAPACMKGESATGGAGTTGTSTGVSGTTGTSTGTSTGVSGTTGTSTGTSTGVSGTTGTSTGTSTGVSGTTGTSTGVSGTTGTSTGVSGTTGTSTGTAGTTGAGGTGGAAVPMKDCATKTKLMQPILINFENYDGTVLLDKYAQAFGGATVGTGSAYAGGYGYGDDSAMPSTTIGAGRPPSMYGITQKVVGASKWGMGGGIWMGCADATAYKGISFWVRGSTSSGVFSIDLGMEQTSMPNATDARAGGTCPGTADTCKGPKKDNIPLTADWTQVMILWADFAPGLSGTTSVVPNGNNITGIGWSVPLKFQLDPSVSADAAGPYIAVPGDVNFDIDDVQFIP